MYNEVSLIKDATIDTKNDLAQVAAVLTVDFILLLT